MKNLLKTFVFALIALCAAASATAQEPIDSYQKWNNGIGHSSWDVSMPPEERAKMEKLWREIGDDSKTSDNNLAGTYVKGGVYIGYFLRLSPRAGFVLIPYFDGNLVADFSYGKIEVVGSSEVVFKPEKDLNGGRSLGKTPLCWTAFGSRLIPVELLADFGDFLAGLGKYNEFNGSCCDYSPNFLARKIDSPENQERFELPAKYQRFIKNPIRAKIVFVGKRKIPKDWGYEGELYSEWMEKAALIPIRINAGKQSGVKPNMLFRLIDQPGGQYLQIVKVAAQTSQGFVVRDLSFGSTETYHDYEIDQEKPLPPIRVGIKATTSPAID